MNHLDNEMITILNSRGKKMSKEINNSMFIRMMLFLVFFAFCTASMYAEPPKTSNLMLNGAGANWKCSNCHQNNWAASHTKDWQGSYYCKKCGHKK